MSTMPDKPEPKPAAADESLPPVSAPGAAFILQLFIIPMIIVGLIVVVWLLIDYMAHVGSDPQDLVQDIGQGDENAWQKAQILADMLRNPRQEHLKYNVGLATQLALLLEEQIEQGATDKNSINLRMFLCRALGEFKVKGEDDAVVRALVAAAEEYLEKERENPMAVNVRQTAIEAMAVLAQNLGPKELRDDRDVWNALKTASIRPQGMAGMEPELREQYERLNSTAAFTMGVVGGDEALDRLAMLTADKYNNTRYNAAVGLARHGDARALPILIEMLDPHLPDEFIPGSERDQFDEEDRKLAKEWGRGLVHINAARAAARLAEESPGGEYSELEDALEKLIDSGPSTAVANEARESLQAIRGRN